MRATFFPWSSIVVTIDGEEEMEEKVSARIPRQIDYEMSERFREDEFVEWVICILRQRGLDE